MIKYAKVINEETGLAEVGLGTNVEFYKSIGMTEQDVEQSDVNNQWYLSAKCPHKTEEEKAQERQSNFESKFLTLDTNKNYRLVPRGYANAQQSIDTVNNMVNALGSLTEELSTMVLFYETPDFTKEEECTEEWLIQHQYSAEPMTKTAWKNFYIDFTTKYAQKMYQQALREMEA